MHLKTTAKLFTSYLLKRHSKVSALVKGIGESTRLGWEVCALCICRPKRNCFAFAQRLIFGEAICLVPIGTILRSFIRAAPKVRPYIETRWT